MIAWFTRHPVAANLLMLSLLLGGWISASHMRKEVLPKLPASEIYVSAYYEGRSAEQIDQELGLKVIRSLEGLSGIKSVTVASQQDSLHVTVKKQLDYDIHKLLSDVKASVEGIYDWPEQAEKAQITLADMTFDALMVQLHGDTDDASLLSAANQVKQALLANPAVHKVKQHGILEYGIYVYLQPEKMQLYQLSFAEVADALHQQSVRSRSGLLKTDNGQFLLQGEHSVESLQQLSQLVVRISDEGQLLRLADVARIHDGFLEHNSELSFNQQPSMAFAVKMAATSDVLEISEQVKAVVSELQQRLPNNLQLTVWFNSADYVESRLTLLSNNAAMGFILVFIILGLFLQLRLAFWVAMGLPVAIAGTLIILGELGFQYTINEVTTFGFILVLGILVDDAVVVGESIYTHKQQLGQGDTTSSVEAAIAGAKKVALPTTFGVLTTVVALLPMTQFPSETGRLFAGFAWVIIVALLFSLLESKLILPAHLRHIRVEKKYSRFAQLRQLPQAGLDICRQRLYLPLLRWSLRYRYAVLISSLALCLLVFGYLYLGKIRSVMFPQVPGDLMIMQIDMEPNTPLPLLQQASAAVKLQRQRINQQFQHQHNISADVIEKSMTITLEQGQILVFAEPLKRELRGAVDLNALAQQWKQALQNLEAVANIDVAVSVEGSAVGNQIIVQHPNVETLGTQTHAVKQWLLAQPGVRSVKDTNAAYMPQLSFTLKPEAQLYGISRRMLAEQLAAGFGGLEVDRFFRGQARVKMYLTLAPQARDSRADLANFYIFNNDGQRFPLSSIATLEASQASNLFYRHNGALSRNLVVDIDKSIASPGQIFQQLNTTYLPQLQQQHPRLDLLPAGELEEVSESQKGLLTAFALAMLGIYILLAVPLQRYWQPLIIMAAIPIGLVGAIIGHVVLGLTVSLYSWLGMLALSGVVVNDSLLIVNRFNEYRAQGLELQNAVIQSCLSRFRAIILTSVTTFAGLYPLLSETSEQAQYLIPAAASMAYGLLFATVISLVLIPIILVICADVAAWLGIQRSTALVDNTRSTVTSH
ncbi:hypothetical protein CHH28_12910 [Bacterioplanes sanyensis]|uniref:Acriflavine resistance protein B n=1 Tax=Bacterioplanes sanyensis TaxID=1249553 RepID=A0A222FKH9_9GAMM|nr:efflux RND transporter permease subunit [Bacterioplanes sanyensis]ASP39518.1 hypothetical protein CHH28_12910 [Bacterioplanes sanyensis]